MGMFGVTGRALSLKTAATSPGTIGEEVPGGDPCGGIIGESREQRRSHGTKRRIAAPSFVLSIFRRSHKLPV